jgi:hypothetical protein
MQLTDAALIGELADYSDEMVDVIATHADRLATQMLRKGAGEYSGSNVEWRAVRTNGARGRRTLTIRYIHIDLPEGQLLFAWS